MKCHPFLLSWKDSNPQPPHLECGALTSSSYRPACRGYSTLFAFFMQGVLIAELAVLFLLQLFQRLFLLLGAFPEEAEISADNQGISLFDVPKRGILKAFHKAVHISRNKYHFNSSR